jgi:hypothetical protein
MPLSSKYCGERYAEVSVRLNNLAPSTNGLFEANLSSITELSRRWVKMEIGLLGIRSMVHFTAIVVLAFVSTMEAKNYPFYGTQWHPEKNNWTYEQVYVFCPVIAGGCPARGSGIGAIEKPQSGALLW